MIYRVLLVLLSISFKFLNLFYIRQCTISILLHEYQGTLRLVSNERFTIEDCLEHASFETDRLRYRSFTPVPKSRYHQVIKAPNDNKLTGTNASTENNFSIVKMKTTEATTGNGDSLVSGSTVNYYNNTVKGIIGPPSEGVSILPLENIAYDNIPKQVTQQSAASTSRDRNVEIILTANSDSNSKPAIVAIVKPENVASVTDGGGISENSADEETGHARRQKYLKKSSVKVSAPDSDRKSSVYETSLILGQNAVKKLGHKDAPSSVNSQILLNDINSVQQNKSSGHERKHRVNTDF